MTTARDPAFIAGLRERLAGTVRDAEPLGRWSTYRIGGPATVVFPANAEDVAIALRHAGEAGVPWFALGLGSNLLFPDHGLDALVIRIGKGLDRLDQDGDRWRIGAGMPAPLAAKRTAHAGWGGIHKMVGVPGSVGGGVVMNAGCHGAEWRDVIESVVVVDPDGNDRVIAAADAGFTYRRSALGHVVVLETTVDLHPADSAALDAETDELYRWRKEGTPFNQPCCGSVFKNPVLPDDWARGAADQRPVHRGDRVQGAARGRGGGLADARQLHRQHRRGHGGRRGGTDAQRARPGRGALGRAAGARG